MKKRILRNLSITLLILQIISCTPERIAIVTQTMLPTITPIENIEPTLSSPTSIFTPQPTLPKEDAIVRFEELVRTNDGCELPCWWGIIPGVTSIAETHNMLAPLANIAKWIFLDAPDHGLIVLNHQLNEVIISISIGYLITTNENVVGLIDVDTQAYDEDYHQLFGNQSYNTLFSSYAIPEILASFGPPKQVLLSLRVFPDHPYLDQDFAIYLLYPQEGIVVRYNTDPVIDGEMVRGCPTNTFITFWLLPPGNEYTFRSTLSSNDQELDALFAGDIFFKQLDVATGMTVEEFYSVFKQPTDRCIESPVSIWPGP